MALCPKGGTDIAASDAPSKRESAVAADARERLIASGAARRFARHVAATGFVNKFAGKLLTELADVARFTGQ